MQLLPVPSHARGVQMVHLHWQVHLLALCATQGVTNLPVKSNVRHAKKVFMLKIWVRLESVQDVLLDRWHQQVQPIVFNAHLGDFECTMRCVTCGVLMKART